ncbi:SOS response-associated peptidase [Rubeoparvulum massiliense]|uniref:SOS response-associated peptidase n=1 Tax=Rubeoparvulum massiliense TaxID=1631346 RepID=UPI00069ED49A|nr:SOS response-associated peptidase [Rubeoparvulum massiliense]
MCGRFHLITPWDQLQLRFHLASLQSEQASGESLGLQSRYNISPGQPILTVISDGKERRAGFLQWGLIPSWSKDPKIAYKMINARSESLAEKPSFRTPFRRQRCLILADGFYEWHEEAHGRQAYRIHLRDNRSFAMAGLWDRWLSPEGEKRYTCTIITTQASSTISRLHHRMPVILQPEVEEAWLNPPEQAPALLQPLLEQNLGDELQYHPVSSLVNNGRIDEPACMEPVSPFDIQ